MAGLTVLCRPALALGRADGLLPRRCRWPVSAAAQVLESVIGYRWKALAPQQREGIRTYLVQKIIAVRVPAARGLCPHCPQIVHVHMPSSTPPWSPRATRLATAVV